MPTDTFFALKKEKRQRIYNAALDEFNSAPYEEVTISSIIKRAGIPRGSFYQYFTDKDDLAVYCVTELVRKSINATYKDNMDFVLNRIYADSPMKISDTSWYNAAAHNQQAALTSRELDFRDTTLINLPRRLILTSSEENAILYYEHFCRLLKAEGIVKPENIKILALYLSMVDQLYQAYIFRNNLDITDTQNHEEAMSMVFRPLQIILDVLRPYPFSSGEHSDYATARLQLLHLSSIRLLSSGGTDVTIPVRSSAAWQMQEDILSIPVDCKKIGGTLKVKLDTCPAETASSSESNQESRRSFESISPDRLSFRVIKNGIRLLATECYIPQNGGVCAVSAKELTGIGTGRDEKKVCLMEDGEFFL